MEILVFGLLYAKRGEANSETTISLLTTAFLQIDPAAAGKLARYMSEMNNPERLRPIVAKWSQWEAE